MDLGNKTLNNLISKDFTVSKNAALDFVNSGNSGLFSLLDEKAEFIFDFIKDKIIKNLKSALDKNNVTNLFEFSKIYSPDFKEFILGGFLAFDLNEDIIKLLESGNAAQKAYALEYFTVKKENNPYILKIAKENILSGFEPLKTASIAFLAAGNEREEYNKALDTLRGESCELEKLLAVEFLTSYGDVAAFDLIYEYFINSALSPYVAENLLLLKSFFEIEEEKALMIFGSILRGYPDEVSFLELDYALQGGVFDMLAETPSCFGAILAFYLREKLKFVLEDEAYSIDLTKDEKSKAKGALSKTKALCDMYDLKEAVYSALNSKEAFVNLIGLELAGKAPEFPLKEIEALFVSSKNDEVILSCARTLQVSGKLRKEVATTALKNVKNEIISKEIMSLY